MKKVLLSIMALLGFVAFATAQSTGTPEQPLTVDEFLELGVPGAAVPNTIVTGYIVGYVPGMSLSEAVFGIEGEVSKTNILLAGASAEDDVEFCIPVQLPAGDVRNSINLADNPSNLGRKVTLCGSREKYFGVNGLKSVSSFAWEGGSIVPPVIEPSVLTSLNESFASIPSTWTNLAVEGDKTFYATSFSDVTYAAMTGYKGTAPFDAWLISPAVDLDKCADKTLSFKTQVNGYGSTKTEFKVFVLNSNDPKTATLAELPATFATAPESGYSSWVESGSIDLSALAGEIYIGFNYTATEDTNYSTWCVTDVRLNSAGTPVTPGDNGSAEAPLSVNEFLEMGIPASAVANTYVEGYIVGYIPGMSLSEAIFGPAAADAQKTNLMIAASASETNIDNCIPVQLPTGDIRAALNLVDNPDNLGRKVTLGGSREKYFGANGLKSVSYYRFDGDPLPPASDAIYRGLVSNADDFTFDQGTLPEGLSYVWTWDNTYGLKASSFYNSTAYVVDAWAISPVIDLTDYTKVTVSLSQAANFFKGEFETLTAFAVREAGSTEWTRVDLPTVPETDSWSFIESGEASLAEFEGKKIEFGFNYTCNGGTCGTWEIKELTVKGDKTGSVASVIDSMSVRVNGRDIIAPEGARVFRANGMTAGTTGLDAGIYIVRVGDRAVKVVVR